jgi:hypothetical protein
MHLPVKMSTLDISIPAESEEEEEDLEDDEIVLTNFSKESCLTEMSEDQETTTTTTSRRSLRRRSVDYFSASDSNLHKINRRTIVKPKKIGNTEKEIRNYYLNNKVRNFRPASLETIFEVPKEEKNSINYIGIRKIKRCLKFSDGLNISKQILQTRRKKIKKLLGSGQKIKKMSMDQFMSHFKELQEITDNDRSESTMSESL